MRGGGSRGDARRRGMGETLSQIELTGGVDAVPRARQFVRDALAAAPEEQRDDAELVVAELVTNAVLHGSPPVTLRLNQAAEFVRVEVHDTGRQRPFAVRGGPDAMTGRGLALVGSLSREWGVEPTSEGGKIVWAEVSETSTGIPAASPFDEADLDTFLESWSDLDDGEEVYLVALGEGPTGLLREAKGQSDNLVREFTLAGSAVEQSSDDGTPSREVAELVQTVVHGF